MEDQKPYDVMGGYLKYNCVFSLLDMIFQNAIRIIQEKKPRVQFDDRFTQLDLLCSAREAKDFTPSDLVKLVDNQFKWYER